MKCQYFEKCGGCSLPLSYEKQLQIKLETFETLEIKGEKEVFQSPRSGYRARGEFKIFRDKNGLHLAMFAKKKPIIIESCPILLPHLQEKLQVLKELININLDFSSKLFGVEVIGSLQGECLFTLLYHRLLDDSWKKEAQELSKILKANIIGRSKGQKLILQEESLKDSININTKTYHFIRYDNSFSQPNPYMNTKMIEFCLSCIDNKALDLLELYCGGGNFTIPLSKKFQKVFATEVAKSSIKALQINLSLNHIKNVFCARVSGEESIEALSFERAFNRLKEINLASYNFSHLLIDPPRSGIGDKKMLEFMKRFPNIIYISCNPLTLKEDLKILLQSHKIKKIALFDQFPYTHHLECGIWLQSLKI